MSSSMIGSYEQGVSCLDASTLRKAVQLSIAAAAFMLSGCAATAPDRDARMQRVGPR